MGNLKITEVPQAQSVAEGNDIYIKSGNNFRRVPISALITLLETSLVTSGFVKATSDGIKEDALAVEPVVISPDFDTPGAYVSSRTADQIYHAFSNNFAIKPKYEYWLDANTPISTRGVVLDVSETESVFAFLDFAASVPKLLIFVVENYSVSATIIPLTGGGGGGSGPAIPTPTAGDNGKYLGIVNGAYALLSAPSGSGATIYGVTAVYRSGYWYIQHDGLDIAAEDIFTALGSGALIRFVDDAGAEGDLLEIDYEGPGTGRLLYKTSNVDNDVPAWRLFEIQDFIVQGAPRAEVTMTPVELLPVSDSRTASTVAAGFTVEGNRVYTVSGTVSGFKLITSTRPPMLPGQYIEIRLTVGSTAITTPIWPSWCKFMNGWDGKFAANISYKITIDSAGNVRAEAVGLAVATLPTPSQLQDGYILVANGQGGYTLTLPEAAAGADGLSPQIKNALLQFAAAAAGLAQSGPEAQAIYQNLYNALYPQSEPAELVSISAVYTQGGATVYDNASLNDLKASLVVTAHYDDNTSEVVQGYTLSGTLTAGTSTVTVTYEGLTTTFSVTVTQHDPLDDIAYGSMTYRELFVSNNLAFLGDFEGQITLSGSDVTFETGKYYKIGAGSPAISTDEAHSPTHSLKAFGSSSTQIQMRGENLSLAAGKYGVCCAVKCERYAAGKVGLQFGTGTSGEALTVAKQATTSGWEAMAGILTVAAARTGYYAYAGTMSSADADGYVDDVVIVPIPAAMTEQELLTVYQAYLAIVGGDE